MLYNLACLFASIKFITACLERYKSNSRTECYTVICIHDKYILVKEILLMDNMAV